MKAYRELSDQGKLRRLHLLALDALANYELKDPQLTYHAFETNLFYRVTTPQGGRYILRLASPGWRTYEDLLAEALWLQALAQETDIPVPVVLPTREGVLVQSISRADVATRWNVSLMSWVPGRRLGHYLTETNLEKMGALFARLHRHGKAWSPPAGFTTRRFEHWLSRGEPNLITGNGVMEGGDRPARGEAGGNPGQAKHRRAVLPSHLQALLERMHQQVEAAYAAVDCTDLRVIHCDLWHDNIKLHRGVLHPFDFEDTVWGFRAHDIAMAMLDLLETAGEGWYPRLLEAFRRGYEAHLPWPAERIESFQVGRMLWVINWVARFQPEHLLKAVERRAAVFEGYERSGVVSLPVAP